MVRIGRFRNQLLTNDNIWSTRYIFGKNDSYSSSSTQWTLVSLKFSIENYGIKLTYSRIDTPQADMCFSNIIKTLSVH